MTPPLPPDPYKILGVSKDAQINEIRSAHRKLVLKCHPDKVQDPALKADKQNEFQKVQQAYELLSDDRERQKYDDQIKLADLRKQFQAQANISTPRSSPKEFNVYTAEPPAAGRSPSSASKVYTFSRSWEDDMVARSARIFDHFSPRSSRREAGHSERSSKRESERERERERDAKDRESRRRKADDARRSEKEAKESRRSEKSKREKLRDKEIRRETDEKKRHARPYVESPDDDLPPSTKWDKKKPSVAKKHEEKRDRSSSGADEHPSSPVASMPLNPKPFPPSAMHYARSYIEATRSTKKGEPPVLQRSKTYHARDVQPPAPTPPPVAVPCAPFATVEDDVRRSSARPRRGSGDSPRQGYQESPRDRYEEPATMNVSPTSRHAAQFASSPAASVHTPSSAPLRREVPRAATFPLEPRPVAGLSRAQTLSSLAEDPRGRGRSRMHAQMEDELESEDAYDYRMRLRGATHRGSRRHRSPEPENTARYQVEGGRAKLQTVYAARRTESDYEAPRYYSTSTGYPVVEHRSVAGREGSYASTGARYPKIKTSKNYEYDVMFSKEPRKVYREEHAALA